jgi:muconolactone delta-isomerase
MKRQFMVDFTLPVLFSEEFTALVPAQRVMVNEYFMEGKLLSYALSLEQSRLWAVFNAESASDVKRYIKAMPLSKMMTSEISELTFFNIIQPSVLPIISLN